MEIINEKSVLENKIKKLDKQISLLTEIRQKCRNQLNKFSLPSVVAEPKAVYSISPEEKASIFLDYFRGRNRN